MGYRIIENNTADDTDDFITVEFTCDQCGYRMLIRGETFEDCLGLWTASGSPFDWLIIEPYLYCNTCKSKYLENGKSYREGLADSER